LGTHVTANPLIGPMVQYHRGQKAEAYMDNSVLGIAITLASVVVLVILRRVVLSFRWSVVQSFMLRWGAAGVRAVEASRARLVRSKPSELRAYRVPVRPLRSRFR